MKLQIADIVLVRLQFHQAPGSKIRPALVVLDTADDDFVAVPITSKAKTSEFDLPLVHWLEAGLNVPSTVRIHKATVLAKADILQRLGGCSAEDRTELVNLLCRAYCNRIPLTPSFPS